MNLSEASHKILTRLRKVEKIHLLAENGVEHFTRNGDLLADLLDGCRGTTSINDVTLWTYEPFADPEAMGSSVEELQKLIVKLIEEEKIFIKICNPKNRSGYIALTGHGRACTYRLLCIIQKYPVLRDFVECALLRYSATGLYRRGLEKTSPMTRLRRCN